MGMIGKFLATRCVAQEDALLTGRLIPFAGALNDDRAGCLIAHAGDRADIIVGFYFDRMCQRLGGGGSQFHSGAMGSDGRAAFAGVARAGEIIRARILSNRLRRTLTGVLQSVEVAHV